MRALLLTELTRLRWRRAVLVLLVAAVVVPALVLAVEGWNTRPHSDDERRAAAVAQAEHERMVARDVARCVEDPDSFGVPLEPGMTDVELAERCRAWSWGAPTTVDDFLYRPVLTPDSVVDGAGVAVVLVVAVGALLTGATYVGQDWASGSISNQLLFETRRGRVWAAKALAVLVWSLGTAVLALGLFWAGVWSLVASRGIAVADGTWADVLATQGRAVLLVAGAGVLGYALTTLFRSTVGSLGLVAAVGVLGTFVPLALLGARVEPWLLPVNALAFLQDGYEYWVEVGPGQGAPGSAPYETDEGRRVLGALRGAAYLLTLLAATVAASVWSFRSRDLP